MTKCVWWEPAPQLPLRARSHCGYSYDTVANQLQSEPTVGGLRQVLQQRDLSTNVLTARSGRPSLLKSAIASPRDSRFPEGRSGVSRHLSELSLPSPRNNCAS